jgi:formylglycine-generating enzyme required for sulfatase activity
MAVVHVLVTLVVTILLAALNPALAAERFRDCPDCPGLVAIPSGAFMMGSTKAETDLLGVPQRLADMERPRHQVTIRAFAAGVFEVSRAEYAAFAAATAQPEIGGCFSRDPAGARAALTDATWRSPGIDQADSEPVICVGWPEVNAYVAWLTQRTGHRYRLLSEAEWEYAARAGSEAPWFWGGAADAACRHANVPPGGFACDDGFSDLAPVGSFRPNAFGLHDMIGNAWEWVADCFHDSYVGAPRDGSAWVDDPACTRHVVRGGGWAASQSLPRSAGRSSDPLTYRGIGLGFRVARDGDGGR